MTKWALSQGCKDSSIFANQSMWYTALTIWMINIIWLSQYMQRKPLTKFNIHLWLKKKNSLESRNRRNIPQHNKSYMWQTHRKHYPQWWKIESISPKVRNKTRMPTLTTTIQHSFGRFSHNNQGVKRNKRNPDWKRSKLSLFADDMILNIEDPKDTTWKLVELINEYSKFVGYKINTQKSLAFLYTKNEKTEREIKETIPDRKSVV